MIAAAHKRVQERLTQVGVAEASPATILVTAECAKCHNPLEFRRPKSAPPGTFSETIMCQRCADMVQGEGSPPSRWKERPPIYSLPPRPAAAEVADVGPADLDEEAFARAAKEVLEEEPVPQVPVFTPTPEQLRALRDVCELPEAKFNALTRKPRPAHPCCGGRGPHRKGCSARRPSAVAPAPIFEPSPALLAHFGLTPTPADETRPEPAEPDETRREPETADAPALEVVCATRAEAAEVERLLPPDVAATTKITVNEKEQSVPETWTCGCGFKSDKGQGIAAHKKSCDGTPWPRPCAACGKPQKNPGSYRMHQKGPCKGQGSAAAAPAKKKARAPAKRALVRRRAPGREPPPKASGHIAATIAQLEERAAGLEAEAAEARKVIETLRRLAS